MSLTAKRPARALGLGQERIHEEATPGRLRSSTGQTLIKRTGNDLLPQRKATPPKEAVRKMLSQWFAWRTGSGKGETQPRGPWQRKRVGPIQEASTSDVFLEGDRCQGEC